MSSSNRTTSKGGKGAKADKSKSDKDSGKGGGDKQQRDANSKGEDPSIKDKVKQLIEMTERSEDEVCLALHECDYDVNHAINMLFESNGPVAEWETHVKKKKNRTASARKQEKAEDAAAAAAAGAADDWNDAGAPQPAGGAPPERERPRGKSGGGPPRLHGRNGDGRGWRGREGRENERNLDEGGYQRGGDRRGRPGPARGGGGGGRGRGGGRAGSRYPPRGNRNNSYNKPIETWDNSNTWDNSTAITTNHTAEETWDDFPGTDEWTTEEYQGSLADTKVFTPSVPPSLEAVAVPEPQPLAPPLADQQLAAAAHQLGQTMQMGQPAAAVAAGPPQSPVPMVGSLTAAQTQYFSQLQQNSDSLSKQYAAGQTYQSQSYEKSTAQYNSTTSQPYSNTQQYVNQTSSYPTSGYQTANSGYSTTQEQAPTQQPARTKTQRARVPPPSKIPASAVEMPGELNSSIGYLDVQFGAMDLMDGGAPFDGPADGGGKYGAQADGGGPATPTGGSLDVAAAGGQALDAYSPKAGAQGSISSALSQSLSNTDSIPQTSEHLTGTYNAATRSTTQGSAAPAASSAAAAGLELSKQPETHSYSQPSTYNSYQSKASTYNSSTYSGTQTTTSSYVPSQATSYVNNQSGTYNPPSGNSYQNAYSSNSSYQSNANSAAFPSISQANSYPSSNQSYPQNTSQSVYGANTGLNNSSSYGNTSTSQYNSYSSGNNQKYVKDSTYDSSSSTASSSQTTTTNNVTSSASLSLSQTTVSTSKTSTTLVAKNSNSVVSNIPPGVAPVMSTPYIMGQVPYFQQPVYSYEDMQLLQQRLPHMTTTPYYDMSYQTPTTLAAVRDAALGNVGYSISDGRFTRGDNNASPVPSTLSQQTSTLTQGHQAQPILAGTAPPYFFATTFNTLAPNYQFGTMYTQLPAATNAHGSSNSNQYPKPATYGSGYGSYDALSQTQDYTKGGYVSNAQGQKGAGANASSAGSAGNDLSAMYGKSHTALGKVNSYEKQGFHSGTPPPFTGTLHGSQNAGLAPTGTGYAPQVYIPTMPPHQQHHSTHLMQQPLHQDSGNSGGQRSQAVNQAKTGAKQPYQASYWNQA